MPAAIAAVNALRPIDAQLQHGAGRQPQLGQTLRLLIQLGPRGELVAADASGLKLVLPPGSAAPGELLLLRVLAQQPRLELQRLPSPAAPAAAPAALPVAAPQPPLTDGAGDEALWQFAALRPDQAWLQRQQMLRAGGLPASVAARWRAHALAELQAAPPPAGALAGAAGVQLLGWLGQALWLRLLVAQPSLWPPLPPLPDEEGTASASGAAGANEEADLCLELPFAGDWLRVLLHWRRGLLLHFSAGQAQTLQRLRERLPRIAAALAAVPLQLRQCRLSLQPPLLHDAGPRRAAQALAAAGSPALLRAAAEIVHLLQQPQPASA